jgi:hypothetical protein
MKKVVFLTLIFLSFSRKALLFCKTKKRFAGKNSKNLGKTEKKW